MPNMDLLGWLVIGFLAGVLSSFLFRDRAPSGCIVTTLIGIMGGAIGGLIARDALGLDQTQGFLGALFVAFVGAVILRFCIALVTPKR